MVVLLLLHGCSRTEMGQTGARQSLDQAAEAMGGWEALHAVSFQGIVNTGSDWDRVVRLYAVSNPHVLDMIGVYFPTE
jgi:hypothetical protein